MPIERLCLSPQCGFASSARSGLPMDLVERKLARSWRWRIRCGGRRYYENRFEQRLRSAVLEIVRKQVALVSDVLC